MQPLIKPPKLNPGDQIAAVTHSWGGPAAFPYRYEMGKIRIEALLNLRVTPTKHALRDPQWLADNPEARAQDLMEAFADSKIKGIFSTIGGNDAIKLLPYIDFDVIRNNPKIFLGFSDSTVIHFMCLKAGLGSFYGPAIMTSFAENVKMYDYTKQGLERTLFSNYPIGPLPWNREGWTKQHLAWENPENQYIQRKLHPLMTWKVLGAEHQSTAGRLIGGCVETLQALMNTPLWPDPTVWKDSILFLETSEEGMLPAQFYEFLESLVKLDVLKNVNGILFSKPGGPNIGEDQFESYDAALKKIVSTYYLNHLRIITHMDFGHTEPLWPLPYGALVEISPRKWEVSLLESGVI